MPRKPKTTRRGKNEGSVYRREGGKWVGQVAIGYQPDNGKPIQKYTYANTREEAAHWVALTLTTEADKAAHPAFGRPAFEGFSPQVAYHVQSP